MELKKIKSFRINENAVYRDPMHYFEIWWNKPKYGPEGEPWKDIPWIVVFYDGEGYDRPIALLLEIFPQNLHKLTPKDWEQLKTLEELPVRFEYKGHKNLNLYELLKIVIPETIEMFKNYPWR